MGKKREKTRIVPTNNPMRAAPKVSRMSAIADPDMLVMCQCWSVVAAKCGRGFMEKEVNGGPVFEEAVQRIRATLNLII